MDNEDTIGTPIPTGIVKPEGVSERKEYHSEIRFQSDIDILKEEINQLSHRLIRISELSADTAARRARTAVRSNPLQAMASAAFGGLLLGALYRARR